MKYKKYLKIILLIFLVNSCGFKPINQGANFKIENFELIGDKKINYIIKNKINNRSNVSGKSLDLQVITKKNKIIKEKNIKNEITKYEITIFSEIKYTIIEQNNQKQFNVSSKGELNVKSKYSDTLNNEKNLTKSLTDDLIKKIIQNIITEINAL